MIGWTMLFPPHSYHGFRTGGIYFPTPRLWATPVTWAQVMGCEWWAELLKVRKLHQSILSEGPVALVVLVWVPNWRHWRWHDPDPKPEFQRNLVQPGGSSRGQLNCSLSNDLLVTVSLWDFRIIPYATLSGGSTTSTVLVFPVQIWPSGIVNLIPLIFLYVFFYPANFGS